MKMLIKTKNNIKTSLEEFIDKHYGKSGTLKRDELEKGYKNFKKLLSLV